jgi:hypothetical protein
MNRRAPPSGETHARKEKSGGKQQDAATRSYGAPETTGLSQLSDIVTLASSAPVDRGVPLPIVDINRNPADQVHQYNLSPSCGYPAGFRR